VAKVTVSQGRGEDSVTEVASGFGIKKAGKLVALMSFEHKSTFMVSWGIGVE
jgi:hypothetical protein